MNHREEGTPNQQPLRQWHTPTVEVLEVSRNTRGGNFAGEGFDSGIIYDS